ncbi:MAG: endopeptidase La [Spirochaetaceae bacterium]|nr:endopeptidase La [Spirochaetaceae bacterium]|tara:strand:- start:326606 stop:329002 length:2397 start_codon:yes stop_codon:yes gene_type:complete
MESVIRYADQNITEIKTADVPFEAPIIPLRNALVYPGVVLPIFVGRAGTLELVEQLGKPGALVALFTQKSADVEQIEQKDLYSTGVLAEIHKVMPMSEGGFQVLLQGIQKIELNRITGKDPYLTGRISPLGEIKDYSEEQFQEFKAHVLSYVESHPGIPDEISSFVRKLTNPSALANQVLFFSQKPAEEKISALRISSIKEKLEMVQSYLVEETQRLKMENEVRKKVDQDTSKMQREFYLRKQLETIRKELGEEDGGDDDELEKQLKEKWLPEEVRKQVNKELNRYRRLQEGPQSGSMESGQIRNWLELVNDLPWEDPEPRSIDLEKASNALEEDHEGLEEVKKRILEHLAVEKQTGGFRAPILCLVGPPGVGKTSLARSVARSMERPLVRSALGGVRDEAEIRGHRRTYVGALPGKILSAMKKAKTRDPVFLLDEIDKTGASYHGDPSAALLEVLDPEQNSHFEDHYLGLSYDLSRALFICTANSLETIPAPLLDRMEVVTLSGYTLAEKEAIARKHLLPKILTDLKLPEGKVQFQNDAIKRVIENHTREAGVRTLKRKLESLARKAVLKIHENPQDESSLVFGRDQVQEHLGRDRFIRDTKEDTRAPGVAIGLAWTPVGGDILYIEAASYEGKGELRLSGQLGDVMKESALAALSFLKANASQLGIDLQKLKHRDLHVHIPSGATPKDGPSAGVTLLAALTSLFTDRPLKDDLAMTGEISLRGRVLPVGGIKEKVLAARTAGINTVFLPEKNRPDFEELPDHVKEGLNAEFYSSMMDLVQNALQEPSPEFVDREGW